MKKIISTFILIFIFTLECYSYNESSSEFRTSAISSGIGLGTVLAVVTSWERNKSVLLAILHGIFSWFYVLYFVLTRKSSESR